MHSLARWVPPRTVVFALGATDCILKETQHKW